MAKQQNPSKSATKRRNANIFGEKPFNSDLDPDDQYQLLEIPIDILDILDYIEQSVRCLREGIRLEVSNSINNLFVYKVAGEFFYIRGQCLSSYTVEWGYDFSLVLHSDYTKWRLSCACPAGILGKCKHVIAGLKYVERLRYIPLLTCTDTQQHWGKTLQRRAIEIRHLTKMTCCVKNAEDFHPELYVQEDQEEFFRLLIESHPESALAKLKNCSRVSNYVLGKGKNQPDGITTDDFQNCVQAVNKLKVADILLEDKSMLQFYNEEIKISLEAAKHLNQNTLSQNNALWSNEMKKRITASSCYSLFTYFKNKAPNWAKKYNDLHKGVVTPEMLYGTKTEPAAFLSYQKQESTVKRSGFCVNPSYPWLGCSPDGIVVEKRKLLEIKCPVKLKNEEFSIDSCKFLEASPDSEGFCLKKKHAYYGQVQLGMFLMHCRSTDLVVYSKFTDSHVTIYVNFDYYFVLHLLETLKSVYFSFLLPIIHNEVK